MDTSADYDYINWCIYEQHNEKTTYEQFVCVCVRARPLESVYTGCFLLYKIKFNITFFLRFSPTPEWNMNEENYEG